MGFRDSLAAVFSRPALTPSLDVVRLDVRIPDLPAPLEGFHLAHVSDLHIGSGAWLPVRAAEAAAVVQAERPDIVVNTGDFLQGEPPVDVVRGLVAPFVLDGAVGVVGPANLAVLGNHDYYAGDEAVCALKTMLRDLGAQALVNETVRVRKDGAELSISGFEELEPGFERALHALGDAPRPRILLVHNADLAERLGPGAADLILAGHTHGGQITLPGLTGLVVRRFNGSKYVQGWYRINGNRVYINRGLGCTGLPFRFRARPEVTFVRLVR